MLFWSTTCGMSDWILLQNIKCKSYYSMPSYYTSNFAGNILDESLIYFSFWCFDIIGPKTKVSKVDIIFYVIVGYFSYSWIRYVKFYNSVLQPNHGLKINKNNIYDPEWIGLKQTCNSLLFLCLISVFLPKFHSFHSILSAFLRSLVGHRPSLWLFILSPTFRYQSFSKFADSTGTTLIMLDTCILIFPN